MQLLIKLINKSVGFYLYFYPGRIHRLVIF